MACSSRRDPQTAFDRANRTFHQGDLTAATQEAEQGYKDFHDASAEWAWKFILLEADALTWRGMSERVPPLFSSLPTPPPTAELSIHKKRLESLSSLYQHDFAQAEKKLQEAESLCGDAKSSTCAEVISARGGFEMERGHFEQAQQIFEKTLGMVRGLGDRFLEANALSSLGWSALQQEHYDAAIDWSNEAYQHAADIGARSIAQTTFGNSGWAYYKLGESEKALNIFLEAQQRAHQEGAVTDEVSWLTTAGYIHLDARDYAAAEKSYNQALNLAEQVKSREDILNALMSLALVAERTGRLDEARSYADRAIAMAPADGNPLDRLYPMLVKGHVAARQHDTAQAEKIYREIEGDHRSHVFLKWEAEHSLALLYEDENKPDQAEHEYRLALSTFEAARSTLQHEESSLPFPANAAGLYDDYIRFLAVRGKTHEALQVAEYYRGRTLAEGLGFLQKATSFKPETVNAQAIAQKTGSTILFYWLGEKQSYLWAVDGHRTRLFSLPARSEIEPVAARYRKALAGQQEFLQTTGADGRNLYDVLVAPAKDFFVKDSSVVIIPDGTLNTLNFETLLTSDSQPRYWIEDVTLTDANSLHLLAAARAVPKAFSKLLLFGNAVAPNSDYPELQNATEEMQSIQKHFPKPRQQVFAREQATPPGYLGSKPEQFSYIHFVAHGTASRSSPLDSAIVLSRSSAQEDSFKLYARDIIHRPLRADLVTISTCYGAGSRAYSGEGLVGLSWAFLRAGAHHVIGALWEVSDTSTPQLMDALYAELNKGNSPQAALRAAKLSMLHSSGVFRKPFYWAPFQLYTGS